MNSYYSSSRLLDIIVALSGLIFLSPLFVVLSFLVWVSGPGPIFYRGMRIGRNERLIPIYKFRTMSVDAEQTIGGRLLTDADSVVTPIGKVLRYLKVDEIPQLLNVLKGDMALVGPRPIRPIFLPIFKAQIPKYEKRFHVLPGITGLAQYRGGYYTTPRHKLRYDLLYIKRQSLWLDMKILLGTVFQLVKRCERGFQGYPLSESQIPTVLSQKVNGNQAIPSSSVESFSRRLREVFWGL